MSGPAASTGQQPPRHPSCCGGVPASFTLHECIESGLYHGTFAVQPTLKMLLIASCYSRISSSIWGCVYKLWEWVIGVLNMLSPRQGAWISTTTEKKTPHTFAHIDSLCGAVAWITVSINTIVTA